MQNRASANVAKQFGILKHMLKINTSYGLKKTTILQA